MAQKNILNQVKTATGYDDLYPLTPYQVYQAKTVTGNGSNYAITIDLPAENITVPIIISFTPNVANAANCTISVNGLASKPLYINNALAIVGTIGTNDTCLVKYDINTDSSTILACSGKLFTSTEIESVIPSGLICMWSGSTVPIGWVLCDGTNGTPNLTDRFIVGSGNKYSIGATGGSESVNLTEAQLPSHQHMLSLGTGSSGSGRFYPYTSLTAGSDLVKASSNRSDRTTTNTETVGSGSAHENRPPYYALAFIMKN